MNQGNYPIKPRILVAPLDWGLGHATRCIPIINQLITNYCDVFLAGDGNIEILLRNQFPQLPFLPLKGYHINYGKTKLDTLTAIVQQIPKLKKSIRYENKWLQKIVQQHGINCVVSDNRFGLYHPGIYTVFITHQLLIKTPIGKIGDGVLQKFNYHYINQFNACWVPDAAGAVNLAGQLSHPKNLPQVPVTYIGALTRFTANGNDSLQHYLLVLLSGPEPQRTLLEETILAQAKLFKNPMLVVRGLPANTGLPAVPHHVVIVNHLPTKTLQVAIEQAQFVISRTGYSTVMDVLQLHKKSIMIPTPGQTEQDYLAQHLLKNNMALCVPQKKFQLKNVVALAENFDYKLPELSTHDGLQHAIQHLLEQLQNKG